MSQSASGARDTAFSALEEAFFAAEILPLDECDLPFEPWTSRAYATLRHLMRTVATRVGIL